MRGIRASALAVLTAVALAGCGGSKPEPGRADAAAACQGSGPNAAALAAKAAAVNPRFATLSVDEHALAANEAMQQDELSDGSSSDDSGVGSLSGDMGVGTTAGQKVLSDCLDLGLQVTHS